MDDAGAGPRRPEGGTSAHEAALNCLVQVASDAWRLARLSRRFIDRLQPEDGARSLNQLRYLHRKIEDELLNCGIRIINLEGQPFDVGVAATALNADELQGLENLYIMQMIEPIVMGPDGLLKTGLMVLGTRVQ